RRVSQCAAVLSHPPRQPGPSHLPPPMARLSDAVSLAIRARHFSHRTEEAYVGWIRRFIDHFEGRHPGELGSKEAVAFLTHLAAKRGVGVATQRQAASALTFLYQDVLNSPIDLPAGIA